MWPPTQPFSYGPLVGFLFKFYLMYRSSSLKKRYIKLQTCVFLVILRLVSHKIPPWSQVLKHSPLGAPYVLCKVSVPFNSCFYLCVIYSTICTNHLSYTWFQIHNVNKQDKTSNFSLWTDVLKIHYICPFWGPIICSARAFL